MKKFMTILAVGLTFGASADTIRATELSSLSLSMQNKLQDETIIVFKKGDVLPITFSAEGDFLETKNQMLENYVEIKKDFWILIQNNDLKMSVDGQTFKPLTEMFTGSLSVGLSSNGINVGLKAFLK